MTNRSRRQFIQIGGGVAVLGAVGGYATADSHDEDEEDGDAHSFELEGTTGGWVGVAPGEIDGEENPTLSLVAGEEYEITFENVDGAPHNLRILDDEDEVLESTEDVEDEGDTATVSFTASEEMAAYDCGIHSNTMRGDLDVEDEEEEEEIDDEEASAFVSVAHLSPDAPNVDVYVDDDLVIEDLPFGELTGYLELPVGSYQVEITAAGDPETSVFDEELEVPEGDFTVAAIGELSGENQEFEVVVLEDDNSDPADGEARVRAFHASPDAPNVDVTVAATGDALFEDVAFGEGGYVEVPEGEYRLCVYAAGDREDAVVAADVELEEGTVYSAWAIGYAADEPALDLAVTVDNIEPGQART